GIGSFIEAMSLSVPFGERTARDYQLGKCCRSDFIAQLPLSDLTGPLHTAGIGWIEFSQMINQR
ncbi:MAG: hypothetical protein V3T17_17130, partial [Pseudomonadales bacterium]